MIGDAALQGIMVTLAARLDYANFKGVIGATPDHRDKLGAYSLFHHEMKEWQREKELPHPIGWVPSRF